MNKSDRINGSIQELMQQQVILPVQAGSESYVIFKSDESQKAYSLLSKDCEMALRLLFRNQFGIRISRQEYQDLQDEFLAFATEKGMVGVKGHRDVGGFRASCYNAMSIEGCEALVACMKEFEAKH